MHGARTVIQIERWWYRIACVARIKNGTARVTKDLPNRRCIARSFPNLARTAKKTHQPPKTLPVDIGAVGRRRSQLGTDLDLK